MQETRDREEARSLDQVIECMDKYKKPITISLTLSQERRNSQVYKKLQQNGIFIYPSPQRAAGALAHLAEYGEYLNHCEGGEN